jgi:pimeloyl-ACP methyl ester carboxylesterase
VFIHGAGRTPASWGPQLARFEGALAVALPGHPDGQPLEGTRAMADWVIAEVGEVPGPLVMAGHSLGGAVALEVALARPDLVSGLVLVSTGARLPVPDDAIARIDTDFEAECARMVEQSWLHHEPELIRRGTGSVISMGPESLRADYVSARDHDVRGRLAGLDIPALVVSGEQDPLVPTWLSEELADELPDATMAVITDAAHVPQLERPEAIDLLVAAFLARLEISLTGDA